ncbi:hypothetical protein FGB62_149g02 [Gracilaria domingensis]|nr:hypothetical protein FGB62_149g02 [Gracilaria domingensis]
MANTLNSSLRPPVQSLHIIYDADGTIAGEFVYMAKKILGIGHCAACDITHGPRKEKPEFTRLKSSWNVPLHNIHRDEMDARMTRATEGRLPCVVARTEEHDVVLVGSDALEDCHGDVFRFQSVLNEALEQADLEVETSAIQFCSLGSVEALDAEVVDAKTMKQERRIRDPDVLCDLESESEAVVPSL